MYKRQVLKEQLAKKSNNVPLEKIDVIPNGFDDKEFIIPSNPPEDKFLMTFTGALANDENKMDDLGEALAVIVKKYPEIKFTVRFVGIIDDSIHELFQRNGIEEILETIPYVPHKEAIEYMKRSTILFYIIRRAPNNEGIVSGKVFDYLGALKPILSIGPENGDAQRILKQCKAGEVIDYEAKEKIVSYLERLLKKWKLNPNIDLVEGDHLYFSRKNLSGKLADIMTSIK